MLAKGGTITAFGDFFTVFCRMLMGIFTVHLFRSPAQFGLYELAYRATFFLRTLALPGTNQGIRRFLPIYRADKNRSAQKGLLLYSLKITAVLSLIVTTAILIFAPGIAKWFQKPDASSYLRILALSIPFYAFLFIAISSLTAIRQVKYEVLVHKILLFGIRLLILFAFMFVGNQTLRNYTVLWSFPVAFGIGCFIAMFFFLKTFGVLRDDKVKPKYHAKEWIKFSLPLAATLPIVFLMNHIGTFIIGYYRPISELGQYGIITRLAPLVIVPLQSVIIVFGPMISELHHLGKADELAKHLKFISKWIFTFSLFVLIIYALLTKPILTVFGRGFSGIRTQHALLIVGLAQLFNAGVGPVGILLAMTGKPRIIMYNTTMVLGLNALLGLILVPLKGPLGGIIGAGLAHAISVVCIKTIYLLQARHYLKIHPFSFGYLKPLIAGLLSSALMFGLIRLIRSYNFWVDLKPENVLDYLSIVGSVFLAASILALVFGLLLYIFGLEEADKFILRKMLHKFRSIRSKNSKEEK